MSQKLKELEGEVQRELEGALQTAQDHIRKAEKVLKDIPSSVLQNGAASGVKDILGKLEHADEAFTTVFQSIAKTHAGTPEEGKPADDDAPDLASVELSVGGYPLKARDEGP